ncbi:MAG: hypothetical protein Q4A32_04860 [Lachnospiraceae bacterium]|nr:hypothetical protein [Lachnospiraceae bacterium]
MSNVKVVEPIDGIAVISLWTNDDNIVDIPLSYQQDITGPFIKEFKMFLQGQKNDRHMVLNVDGEEGKFLIISDDERTFVVDELGEKLSVCPAKAEDIIKACMKNFIDYQDQWANFDIDDDQGVSMHYMQDFMERKGLIEHAEDEIYRYLKARHKKI